MRRTATALVATALLVAGAGTAQAAANQTAKDVAVQQLPGFHLEASTAHKGPVRHQECGRSVTTVPRGATSLEQSFSRTLSGTTYDDVQVTTVLLKDAATAKRTFLAQRLAARHCLRADVSDPSTGTELHTTRTITVAPTLRHTDRGFTDTATGGGTIKAFGKTVVVSGVEVAVTYQRGRAITTVDLVRDTDVLSADGTTITETSTSDATTRAELRQILTRTVAALGRQR